MKNPILKISDPPQYGILLEDNNVALDKSIFFEVYKTAIHNVCNIIQTNEKLKKHGSEDFFNTTIAFVGKRGTGKSTAMCSFASFLESGQFGWVKKHDENNGSELSENRFWCLNSIDSAQLGTKETIIGRISAAMYKQYLGYVSKCGLSITTDQKRAFLKQVQLVNKYAVMYHSGEWFRQSENLLSDTHHVSALRNEVQDLIYAYLRLVAGKTNIENEYLVVSIDDIDMCIENSYSIMEEIRKFLCVKNIVVLVTLRMDQIHVALRAKFENQLCKKNINGKEAALLDDLAYRYTEKLFPYARQIHMPRLSYENMHRWKADFGLALKTADFDNVLCALLNLVWRKTMLLLVCNSNNYHILFPKNLRSLCNFVVLMRGLHDIEYKIREDSNSIELMDGANETLRGNLNIFLSYLLENTCSFEYQYLSDDDAALAERLILIVKRMEAMSLGELNSMVVGEIISYLNTLPANTQYSKLFHKTCFKPNGVQETNEAKDMFVDEVLLEASSNKYSISLGDLMYVLGEIDNKTSSEYINYLIELIRTLWSIKMTEEYFYLCLPNRQLYPRFLCSIGGLIVNPDIGFLESDKSDFAVTEGGNINDALLSYVCKNVEDCRWRSQGPNGKYFGQYEKHSEETLRHPMGVFTNVIRPHEASNSLRETIPDRAWLPLPFYSMDFMYRFCEILHDQLQSSNNIKYSVEGVLRCAISTVHKLIKSPVSSDDGTLGFVAIEKYIDRDMAQSLYNMLCDLYLKVIINIKKQDILDWITACENSSTIAEFQKQDFFEGFEESFAELKTTVDEHSSDLQTLKELFKSKVDRIIDKRIESIVLKSEI